MEIKAVIRYGEKQGIYLSFSNKIGYISQGSFSLLLPFGLSSPDQAIANKPYYPILPYYNSEKIRDWSGIVIDSSIPQQYWYGSTIMDNAYTFCTTS